jgi:ribosomal RNA assembly protein
MEEILKINKRRLPVVIGNNGSTKKDLERKCNVSLDIESSSAEIIISSNNYYNVYISKKIINAIARGFSPEHAFKLLNDNFNLDIISIKDFTGKNEKRINQIKGRVIGKDGKFKIYLETKFGCFISVFGNTVSIISRSEDINSIREIIEVLLKGQKHTSAFKLTKIRSSGFNKRNTKTIPKTQEQNQIDDISF